MSGVPLSAADFSVRVFDHAWGRILLPAGVTFAPQSWDAEAIGGSLTAEVAAVGELSRLLELGNWLGYRLWIMSPDNEYVWWGNIEEVVFAHNGATVGASLDGVANRLQVLYTDDAPGGEMDSAETDWSQNNASISLYGLRERKHSAQNPMRAPQAEQMRNTLLGSVSRPVSVISQIAMGNDETQVTLRCKGFWSALSHIYYTDNNGLVEHTTGGTAWPLGLGFTSNFVAAKNNDETYGFAQMYGRFMHFGEYQDLRITLTGSTSNDGTYTVLSGDAKEPVSYNSNLVKFIVNDDIEDTNEGLTPFESGDLVQISGSAANSGTHLVKTPGKGHIEVSPSYIGHNLNNENPGPNINFLRGNGIEVEQAITKESCGQTITVVAHGQRIAQAFWTATSGEWVAATVEIKMRKVGEPVDDVLVRLHAYSGGAPGTLLATATILAADISADEQGRWMSAAFDVPVVLANSGPYWLAVSRTAANDSADYYEVYIDDTGSYTLGGLVLYDGSVYTLPVNPLSLLFRIRGAVDTALQVKAMCEATGVFIGVQTSDLSGLKTCQYRDGSLYAADEASELLDTGDGSNTRLIATVNPQRWALIRKQPAPTEARYLWRNGTLCTLQGKPVLPGLLPVGEWCHIDDPLLLQGALATASPFFIESASYSPEAGWQLRAAGEPDPWKIGETLDG